MGDASIRLARLRRQAAKLPVRAGDGWSGQGLTVFAIDHRRLHELHELIDDYGMAEDDKAEWPNNTLSKRTVIYECGRFARTRYRPRFDVDEGEMELCRRISAAAKAMVGDKYIGLGDANDHPFVPFFIVADTFTPAPATIDAGLVTKLFGGALFPPYSITVEPLSREAGWWAEVQEYPGCAPEYMDFAAWDELITFFTTETDLAQTVHVSVGTEKEKDFGDEDDWPPGTVMAPCVFPRMVLGLTPRGSVCGLLTWPVWA